MTWLEFNDAVRVFLTVDADRLNIQPFITQQIRQAVIDIQSYIDLYRTGHVTVFTIDDVIERGEAHEGNMPDQSQIRDIFYSREGYDYQCIRQPLYHYSWDNRYDLVCGNMGSCQYAIAIDPQSETFLVWPALIDGRELWMTWDGIKIDFDDGDTVPFDEQMVSVVADYVLSKIERRVNKDLAMEKSYWQSYTKGRQRLYLDAQDRKRIRNNRPSPQVNGDNCVSCDAATTTDTDETSADSYLTADTLADLRAITTGADGVIVILLGYAAAYDQRAEIYSWDEDGTEADNYPMVVRPDDFVTSGVWRQVL